MAYWSVDYNHPKKGWVTVANKASKKEAEDFIKASEEAHIVGDTVMERLQEKFRFRKTKGNLNIGEKNDQ